MVHRLPLPLKPKGLLGDTLHTPPHRPPERPDERRGDARSRQVPPLGDALLMFGVVRRDGEADGAVEKEVPDGDAEHLARDGPMALHGGGGGVK